jgi:hypothetical protein
MLGNDNKNNYRALEQEINNNNNSNNNNNNKRFYIMQINIKAKDV